MRHLALLLLGLGMAISAAESEDPCQQGSAMAANLCHGPAWQAAEDELQRSYDRLLSHFKEYEPELVVELRDAQRSWIRQREQSCSLYARSRVQGSPWTGFWAAQCMAEQARARAAWLKSMLEDEF
ncbi:lysozyme inhibitor LprI family protein [Ectopseudomonas hydrolytica]|nr:lysozyme inhibitor LprI family protein [Pseudomonas hydrolytica]MBF8162339.1 DUF1311 domain-containing protein [Pseudomonas mendocina]UTH33214.1 DUF1311 domain-containing protein [Pseudomonas hydrolytica]UZZ12517.1 DUF1311 domain-containing protein [Pseudomonas mendocina]